MNKSDELKAKYEKKEYVPVEKADLECMLEKVDIVGKVEYILAWADGDEEKLANIIDLFYNN